MQLFCELFFIFTQNQAMKNLYKFLLLIVLFSGSLQVKAQYFALQGSTWHYKNVYAVWPGPSGSVVEDYLSITANGDTTIEGHLCTKLQYNQSLFCVDNQSVKYTYYANDTVYFYDQVLNTYQTLYNFSATVGDTWDIRVPDNFGEDTISVRIDSVNIININGINLKRQFVTYTTHFTDIEDFEYQSVVIERIGDLHFLFNLNPEWSYACDATIITGLRCFEDNIVAQFSTGISPSCTYVAYAGTNEIAAPHITIFPNPSSDFIELSNPDQTVYSYEIFDLSGKLVQHGSATDFIDLSLVQTGSYSLKLSSGAASFLEKFQVLK
ncbi:MAG: hypothetical protein RIT34_927 [Bacteroidota bacterium]|jgi:hypothetical protein